MLNRSLLQYRREASSAVWEARNITKGGELMGVDMLLLDEKENVFTRLLRSSFTHHNGHSP
ncbi:unnamed protein product [Brassica napus]|nr:unnamed protein product [Brassica napus]